MLGGGLGGDLLVLEEGKNPLEKCAGRWQPVTLGCRGEELRSGGRQAGVGTLGCCPGNGEG